MPSNVEDLHKRLEEIDRRLAESSNDDGDARQALERERQAVQDQIDAREEFDQNENSQMSSTDETVERGRPRPDSHPLHKPRDKISNSTSTETTETVQGAEKHEEKASPPPHDGENSDGDTGGGGGGGGLGGIRTIPVPVVKVQPGPKLQQQKQQQQQPATNQYQDRMLRALNRPEHQQAYRSTPNLWQYPDPGTSFNQVGLVTQSYKQYFGMS